MLLAPDSGDPEADGEGTDERVKAYVPFNPEKGWREMVLL